MALQLGKRKRAFTADMQVVWLDKAIHDLIMIKAYIQADNPAASKKVGRTITEIATLLAQQPEMGRLRPCGKVRELIIPGLPYILPYRIRKKDVQILRVLHTSRKWPYTLN